MNRKKQFTFISYYCPNCGEIIASDNFLSKAKQPSSFTPLPRCPSCEINLLTSGRPLIIIGIPIFIFCMLIMSWEVNLVGGGLGLTFIIIGLIRVNKRLFAKRKFQKDTQTTEKD